MKTLLAIIATAVFCYLLLSQSKLVRVPEQPLPPASPIPLPVVAKTPAPPARQDPATLRKHTSQGTIEEVRSDWDEYVRTAPRIEARGTLVRHMGNGQILVNGSIANPRNRGISYETYLLFGLPEAERLADGETFDAFAVMGDAIEIAGGSRVREYIFVSESGRRPSRFELHSGIYGRR